MSPRFSLRAILDAHAPGGASGLVVALSGGADSAALLSALAADPPFRGLPLRAVHIDHDLQPAAAAFREACRTMCAELSVPLTVIRVAVPALRGVSLEAGAREARYAALAAELKPAECLLTAHHREDQAETLLLQALRGAGLKGLSAMPICRPLGLGWHLRPLLEVAQAELLASAARASEAARLDPMNEDVRFDRSYLRGRVWPLIATRWPGAAATLSRAAGHLAEAQTLLDGTAATLVGRLRDGDALSVPLLRTLGPPERINAMRYWLGEAGAEPPSTARLSEALRQMFDAKADHAPAVIWGAHALRRYRQRVFLTDAEPPRLEGSRSWRCAPGARLALGPNLGELAWIAHEGGLDAARLPEFLTVRPREGGETLRSSAHAKTHTVQHLCQAYGVLPWMRDALPLVFAADALIAIGDLWLDARWCAPAGQPGLAIAWTGAPIVV
jgi:tRNA(Ile)-lysidine synthase